MKRTTILAAVLLGVSAHQSLAISILVDYSQDTNNFFDTQAKMDAMEAVVDRYERIITSSLDAVTPAGTGTGTGAGWRIGFSHPGTGSTFEVSTSTSAATDPLDPFVGPADLYGFGGLAADTWILYAGGRSLTSAAEGGTATGTNFTSTFNDLNGPMHRGLISNTPGNTTNDLPVWGGAISFDNDAGRTWHFDPTTAAPLGETDFYSIALHEVGHALGLNLSWNQWQDDVTGSTYAGSQTLAAYNADNGTSLTSLDMVSSSNFHWAEDTYDSVIFPHGTPNYIGTVGAGILQDTLMEPTADFTASIRRLELTNTDVAALEDLGWSVIPEPSVALLLGLGASFVGLRRRK